MTRSRTFFMTVAALILGLAMTATALAADLRQQLVEQSTLEQVLQRGTLRVGMSTFVPWAMKDKTGELIVV